MSDSLPWTYYPELVSPAAYEELIPYFDPLCARQVSYFGEKKFTTGRRMSVVADRGAERGPDRGAERGPDRGAERGPDLKNQDGGFSRFLREKSYISRYRSIPTVDWEEAPEYFSLLRRDLEQKCGVTVDYALVNIYDCGQDTVGWHSDAEAMASDIISVSLGETRVFRFRQKAPGAEREPQAYDREADSPKKRKKSWSHEYELKSGDVIHMRGTRQAEDGSRLPSCQELYEHCLPKRMNKGKRLNLTFRSY